MMNSKSHLFKALALATCLFSAPAFSQSIVSDRRLWINGHFHGHLFNEKTRYLFQPQLRLRDEEDINTFDAVVVRTGVGYQVTDTTSLWLGYDFIPRKNNALNRLNLNQRTWQQILINAIENEKITLSMRTRLEERFNETEPGTAYRLRQKFSMTFPSLKRDKVTPAFYNEILLNLNNPERVNKEFVNQNRLFFGLEYQINDISSIRFGYLNRFRIRDPQDRIDHILLIVIRVREDIFYKSNQ